MTRTDQTLPLAGDRRRRPGRPRTPAFDRTAVVDAVVDLVCERGFAGWSMRELAARLGISTGTLTHHFASREAVAIAAMDFVYVLPADWPTVRDHPPMERLERMTAIYVLDTPGKRRWWQFWVEYMAVAGRDAALRDHHEDRYARQRSFFARLLAELSRPGFDPKTEAARLIAFGNGLAIQQLATPTSLPAERARVLVARYLQDLAVSTP